jgi:hypothetical protein
MGRLAGPAAHPPRARAYLAGAIQFAVTKFLAIGSHVPLFAAITLGVQKPLSNSSEALF